MADTILEAIRLQNDEWQAWQEVCSELKRLGIDINDEDSLNQRLVCWGNLLVELRSKQAG